ncbi:ATP synthase F1, gamma subunit [Alkaliphilus metalliredigens QYMF]|uniref:ATP synthase gamma chain n=1 Tax=Alkaliphilus metalliredigens (strain QYMF) TaxID=293826 RepID=ATPG_ALKMQ|nr:ATP synthase F1 subunit gamma [Alkaliphilus metalliredigens]A6TK64.1 RecName: Full=ATP synthase gamma chain; AltName: Full=ATP synthase F1 sector gamma subunit; AltName: Full=F-ATPase gamma subunit [Alkaliphilus metalliredigens QYMF]ABR46582.1 ATP synthase F1, gamma subunit [Alkaliphilus metalliredigens QYMF]
MGVGMQDIKRRIKSVNSTKQITKAMELVSSAKLRKARLKLEKTRPYFKVVEETINDIVSSTQGIRHDLITPREVKKTAYIVITADRGLSGGYNANVIKAAVNHLQEKERVSIIAIGKKGRGFFRKRGYDLDGEFTKISENPSFSDAQGIGKLGMELYKQELVDELYLVYTEFVSTITHKPRVVKLLPLEPQTGGEGAEKPKERDEFMSYEPSPEEVLDYLIPKYIESMLYGALVESSTSQQGATRVAMESATDNATDMIDGLQLQYNRARQASITQEIAEIVSGAEALK